MGQREMTRKPLVGTPSPLEDEPPLVQLLHGQEEWRKDCGYSADHLLFRDILTTLRTVSSSLDTPHQTMNFCFDVKRLHPNRIELNSAYDGRFSETRDPRPPGTLSQPRPTAALAGPGEEQAGLVRERRLW